MKPTPEQEHCLSEFAKEQSLKINAYAGSGKTSSCVMMAKSTRRRGTYVCFNASVAKEAQRKFPNSVACSTMHSLAFRQMKEVYSFTKMTESLNGVMLAEKLRLKDYMLAGDIMGPRKVGFLLKESINRFQRSGRSEVSKWDVAVVGKLEFLDEKYLEQYRSWMLPQVKSLWEMQLDPHSDIPGGHDFYLKAFAMRRPQLPGDYILLDEAQDTNGVVLELMRHQKAQVAAVGDRWQAIYSWRGALNAMTDLPYENEARLSTSFRFGEEIADYATQILRVLGETVPLKGNPAKQSSIGPVENPRAILCRTNGGVIAELISVLDRDLTPCIVGGTSELLAWVSAAEKLMAGRPVESPAEFYGFKDWEEVRKISKEDEGKDLRRWVQLIDQHGTGELRRILMGLPKGEEDADVVLSTGHKAKGREWDTVRLSSDFLMGASEDEVKDCSDEELRLFYVAATRAMKRIQIPESLNKKLDKVAQARGKSFTAPTPKPEVVAATPVPVPQFAESLF